MRKIVCLLVAVMLCVCLASNVYATEFVPSISEKPEPKLISGSIMKDGKAIAELDEDCLLVTPVSKAKDSEQLPDAAEEMLMMVFSKLSDGSMTLPYEKISDKINPDNMVIRDLFDVTWLCGDHPDVVAPSGVTVSLTFDLGVAKDVKVYSMTYKDGQWIPAVSVVNNGDGTVTCQYENFCPVVFAVETGAVNPPAKTGDDANLTLWITLAVVAGVALVTLVIVRRKIVR